MSKYLIILLLLAATPARASEQNSNLNCEEIRHHVSQYGIAASIKWALQNGYKWKDIWKARKACSV